MIPNPSPQSKARATQIANERERAASFDDLPDSAVVNVRVVADLVGISIQGIHWRIRAGLLPQPHRLGTRRLYWSAGEIRAALRTKK